VADSATTGPGATDEGGQQKQRAPELDGKAFGSILKSNAEAPDRQTNNSDEGDAVRRAFAMNNTKRHKAPEQEMLPYFGDHQ
jgi:hypothetical protein